MSTFGASSGDFNQRAGMTLSEIAYSEAKNIPLQLAYKGYATEGNWTCNWIGVSPGNQMYVAQNRHTKQWAVVIRGSATDPLTEKFWVDWFEQDLTNLVMDDLQFPGKHPGAKIAWGTKIGLEDLVAMRSLYYPHKTLVEHLNEHAELSTENIAVMGHSLGGNLATVLAAYLAEVLCKPNKKPPSCIVPLTFAGPTSGNQDFCTYVQDLFGGFPFRYWNSLDIVPHSWELSGLDWILKSYPSPGPKIGTILHGLVDVTWWLLYENSLLYMQPGGNGVPTTGTIQKDYWWFMEAGHQHSGETYLKMYGAPPVVYPPPKFSTVQEIPRAQRKLGNKKKKKRSVST